MSGRYLIYAYDSYRGSAVTTYDANDRSGTNRLDMHLRPTRRPTIQVVLMSEDRNEPIGNADIEVFTNETGRRDNIRSNSSGLTPFDIPGSTRGGRFDLTISSRDFDTVYKTLNFRAKSDTDVMVYYVQMRRKTWRQPRNDRPTHDRYQLDGMIRTSNKDREEVGGLVTINVGLMYSGGQALNTRGREVVTITRPDGSTILNESTSVDLRLNEYANRSYDIRPDREGTYTVSVRADGEDSTHWTGRYTFVVHRRSQGNNDRAGADLSMTPGDYLGNADIEMDNREIRSHQISITLIDGARDRDNVKGWMSPRQSDGFSITFKGTFDYHNGVLDATGTLNDRTDKRWDIRLTGRPDRNGRCNARLVIRATDNSYNRSFNFILAKR